MLLPTRLPHLCVPVPYFPLGDSGTDDTGPVLDMISMLGRAGRKASQLAREIEKFSVAEKISLN